MLVINQLHKSSSVLLLILRFYESVSTSTNPSLSYLRLLQASFGGYVASVSTNNSEYQQRWSAYLFFQLPRLLASCIETQLDHVKEAVENFLLHNQYLLHRLDDLCSENVLEQLIQTTLNYTNNEVKEKNQTKISQLLAYIQKIRGPYVKTVQQHHINQQACLFLTFLSFFCVFSLFLPLQILIPIKFFNHNVHSSKLFSKFSHQIMTKIFNY